jgi:FkbM family methyltransferase
MRTASILSALHSRFIRGINRQLGLALGKVVGLLPSPAQSYLLDQLNPVGRLDYKNADIAMGVRSSWANYRLSSCAKEPETVAWLGKTIVSGDVFCDVGANVGAYTLVAASIMNSTGTVYAVEPSFTTFAQLSENIVLNHMLNPGVRVIPIYAGLAESTCIETLGISDIHAGSARHIWAGQPHQQEGDGVVDLTLPVMCYSLDDMVSRFGLPMPTVMKVDVDGPEVAVIKGAIGCLSNNNFRSLLIELDDSQLALLMPIFESTGLSLSEKYNRGGRWSNYIFNKSAG